MSQEVIHYQHRNSENAVCGSRPQTLTDDPEKVTCKSCRNTKAHNSALNAKLNKQTYDAYYAAGPGTKHALTVALDEKDGARAMAARAVRERDEARKELADMRALMSEVLSEFDFSTDDCHSATVTSDQFERWLKLAGIEAL